MIRSTFFDGPKSRELLREELESWLGTPFFKSSRAKGKNAGVDCVHLIQEVYYNLGVIDERYPMPQYSIDWHKHCDNSLLKAYLEKFHKADFRVVDMKNGLMAGDLLLINPRGKCLHHGGIMKDEHSFVHALQRVGVVSTAVRGSGYGFKVEEVWRPVKK